VLFRSQAFDLAETGFLTVSTFLYGQDSTDLTRRGGMGAIIRIYDDKVVASWQYGEDADDLSNDGVYITIPMVRKT